MNNVHSVIHTVAWISSITRFSSKEMPKIRGTRQCEGLWNQWDNLETSFSGKTWSGRGEKVAEWESESTENMRLKKDFIQHYTYLERGWTWRIGRNLKFTCHWYLSYSKLMFNDFMINHRHRCLAFSPKPSGSFLLEVYQMAAFSSANCTRWEEFPYLGWIRTFLQLLPTKPGLLNEITQDYD